MSNPRSLALMACRTYLRWSLLSRPSTPITGTLVTLVDTVKRNVATDAYARREPTHLHSSSRPPPSGSSLLSSPDIIGEVVRLGRVRASQRGLHTTRSIGSGHNRWSKIRHKKGAVDSQRSALFSRISNEIYTAIKLAPSTPSIGLSTDPSFAGVSGAAPPSDASDPTSNPRLAAILSKAREVGFPRANVDAAIHKALNPHEGVTLSAATYEAILPPPKAASSSVNTASNGTSLIIECLTDNPNRSISRVKEQLSKFGARLSPCAFMFERKGLIRVRVQGGENSAATSERSGDDTDEAYWKLFEVGVDAGAEDVRAADSEGEESDAPGGPVYEVITPLSSLFSITQVLASSTSSGFTILASEPAYLANDPVHLPADLVAGEDADSDQSNGGKRERISEELAEKAASLLAALDEVGDVTRVWTNVAGL